MNKNERYQIIVHNVINPQRFWFRTLQDEEELKDRLQTYIEQCSSTGYYVPNVDELVIALAYNRYSIVRVISVDENNNQVRYFILENGHTGSDSINSFIALNDTSLSHFVINTILTGSICGVKPAKMVCKIQFFFTFDKKNENN